MIEFKGVSFSYPEEKREILKDISLTLPKGVISLLGPNGTGKSTFLLLAGGCLLPQAGSVFINKIDTQELRDEESREQFVSFIFQNMEFETGQTIGELLPQVYEGGFWREKQSTFIDELVDVFELRTVLHKKTQEVSKGELQRTILAFSLLYGSEYLMMDEPVFALEEYQKHKALEYITSFIKAHNLGLLYSVHEFELSQKYSDYLLVFSKTEPPLLGPTPELFTPALLEKVYQLPYSLLKTKENIFRESLKRGD